MESDYKFIKEPDDVLKCCICLEIARNPKQEEGCGTLFCSGCIEEWGGGGGGGIVSRSRDSQGQF